MNHPMLTRSVYDMRTGERHVVKSYQVMTDVQAHHQAKKMLNIYRESTKEIRESMSRTQRDWDTIPVTEEEALRFLYVAYRIPAIEQVSLFLWEIIEYYAGFGSDIDKKLLEMRECIRK